MLIKKSMFLNSDSLGLRFGLGMSIFLYLPTWLCSSLWFGSHSPYSPHDSLVEVGSVGEDLTLEKKIHV